MTSSRRAKTWYGVVALWSEGVFLESDLDESILDSFAEARSLQKRLRKTYDEGGWVDTPLILVKIEEIREEHVCVHS